MARPEKPFRNRRDLPEWWVADEYTKEERDRFQIEFGKAAPMVRRRHAKARVVAVAALTLMCGSGLVGLLWISFIRFEFLPKELLLDLILLLGIPFGLFLVSVVVATLFWPKVSCPACSNRLGVSVFGIGEAGSARFCPKCGNNEWKSDSVFVTERCGGCNLKYFPSWFWSPYRFWPAKYCPFCGVELDEKGV